MTSAHNSYSPRPTHNNDSNSNYYYSELSPLSSLPCVLNNQPCFFHEPFNQALPESKPNDQCVPLTCMYQGYLLCDRECHPISFISTQPPSALTMTSTPPHLHSIINRTCCENGHVIGHYGGLQQPYHNSTNSSPIDYRTTICEDRLSKTNIYIRGLPKEFNDQDLARLCQSVGRIRSLKAIMDKDTNKCKGYGFVDFESPESAMAALKKINSSTNYHAQMAKQQEQDPTNLYFANLSVNVNEVILEDVLQQYGQVISARILRDNNSRSKGVGFARMETKEICDNIINALNGKRDDRLGDKDILVKFADGSKKSKHSSQNRYSTLSNPISPADLFASSLTSQFNSAAGYTPSGATGAAAQLQLMHQNPSFIEGFHNSAYYRALPSASAYAQHNPHTAAALQQINHYGNQNGQLFLINQYTNSASNISEVTQDVDASPRLSPQLNAYSSNDHMISQPKSSGIINNNNNVTAPPIYFAATPANILHASAAHVNPQQLAAAFSQMHIGNTGNNGQQPTYFSSPCPPAPSMHITYPYQVYQQNHQQSSYYPQNLYHSVCNTNNAALMATHPQIANAAAAGYLSMAAGSVPPTAINTPLLFSYVDGQTRCFIPGMIPASHNITQLHSTSSNSSLEDQCNIHHRYHYQHVYHSDSGDSSDHAVHTGATYENEKGMRGDDPYNNDVGSDENGMSNEEECCSKLIQTNMYDKRDDCLDKSPSSGSTDSASESSSATITTSVSSSILHHSIGVGLAQIQSESDKNISL